MRKIILALVAVVAPMCTLMGQSTTLPISGNVVSPDNPLIQYTGRISFANPKAPSFTFPGVKIKAGFTGTSLRLWCKPESGYFMAQIDKAEAFKVAFSGPRDSVVTLATALQPGQHQVELMYCMEGLNRKPVFRGLILDSDGQLIESGQRPQRHIEFIGNSITCGYGVESTNAPDPFEDETENHYLTYAQLTARALNAEAMVVARSGIGVYRNYDGPKTGSSDPMPMRYEFTNFGETNERWDFSRFTPEVVCINLGTNDFSTNNYDTKRYEKAYRNFVSQVRGHYPNAMLVLLTGPMLGEKENSQQQKILNSICADLNKAGDKKVCRFDFTPQTGNLKYGASWHPSLWQHQKMGAELTSFLRQLMNWF